MTALPIQLGTGFLTRALAITSADFDRRNAGMRVRRIGMDSICSHGDPRPLTYKTPTAGVYLSNQTDRLRAYGPSPKLFGKSQTHERIILVITKKVKRI